MIIAGNSHVALFRKRLKDRSTDETIPVKWVGALTASHFIHNHSAGRAIRFAFEATKDWKILSIGMHDIFELCRAYFQNCYQQTFDQLVRQYQSIFTACNCNGKFGWIVSPQQLDGPGTFGLSKEKVYSISEEFNRTISKWCEQQKIKVINPLSTILDDTLRPKADLLQKDGIHLNERALAAYVQLLIKYTGVDISCESLQRPNVHCVQARTEPESLSLLVADELNLGWDQSGMPYGQREAFERKILDYIAGLLVKKGASLNLDRHGIYNSDGVLNTTELVDIYNYASDLFGSEINFDVNIRQLDTVEKISDFFLKQRPLTKNDFFETLAHDTVSNVRSSETVMADSKIAAIDDKLYQSLKEIIHNQTGGVPCQYGIIYFWFALIEAERGNLGFAINLLQNARSPELSFPFCSARVNNYIKLWNQKRIANKGTIGKDSIGEESSYLQVQHAINAHDLLSAWCDQIGALREKIEKLYVVTSEDNCNSYLQLFPKLKSLDVFVPIPEVFGRMLKNIGHDPRIKIWPYMLSDHNGYDVIGFVNQNNATTLYADEMICDEPCTVITTETFAINEFIRNHAHKKPDLLICTIRGLTQRLCHSLSIDLSNQLKAVFTVARSRPRHLVLGDQTAGAINHTKPYVLFGTVQTGRKDVLYWPTLYVNPTYSAPLYKRQASLRRIQEKASSLFKMVTADNDLPDGIEQQAGALIDKLYHNSLRLLKNNQNQDALFAFKLAIETNPQHSKAHFQIGMLLHQEHKLAEALPYFASAFAISPFDRAIAKAYAETLIEYGHEDKANWVCQRYLAQHMHKSYCPEPLLTGKARLKGFPKPDVTESMQAIQALIHRGCHDEAYGALDRLLAKYPDFAQGHNDLGVLAYQKGDLTKALSSYRAAVRLEPENITFKKNLADFLYVEQKQTKEAMRLYIDILDRKPDDIETLSAIATICTDLNRLDDAAEFHRRILELDPENHWAKKGCFAEESNSASALRSAEERLSTTQTDEPIVSAIVSAYNSERFIRGRLENLEAQTIAPRLEIIVVDSGSPQNEAEIVREFQARNNNIHYIRTEQRETVYAAWNRGIRAAKGKYIVNANTDDRFAPDALEVMADTLDNQSEYDAVYGDWLITQAENDKFESNTSKRLFKYPEFHPGLFFYLQVTSHASFVRRCVFEKIGMFDGSFTVFGDREFMFRFCKNGLKAIKLDRIIGLYLENPDSVERSNKSIGKKECERLYEYYSSPEVFSLLCGQNKGIESEKLSELYTIAGCFGRGIFRTHNSRYDALHSSLVLFVKAIELSPNNSVALNNLGVISQIFGSFETASDFFKTARIQANHKQKSILNKNILASKNKSKEPNDFSFLYPQGYRSFYIVEKKHLDKQQELFSSNISIKSQNSSPAISDQRIFEGQADKKGSDIAIEKSTRKTSSTISLVIISKKSKLSNTIISDFNNLFDGKANIELFLIGANRNRKNLMRRINVPTEIRFIPVQRKDRPGQILNRIVTEASGDTIVVVREDAVLDSGCFRALIETREYTMKPGVSGPLTKNTRFHRQRSGDRVGELIRALPSRRIPVPSLDDFCFLFDRTSFDSLSGFDENYQSLVFTLQDFCKRLAMHGYENFISADVVIQRSGSGNNKEIWSSSNKQKDRFLFHSKWGEIRTDTDAARKATSLFWTEQAVEHYYKDNLTAAADALEKAIDAHPDNWNAYRLLTDVLTISAPGSELWELVRSLRKRAHLPGWMAAAVGCCFEMAGDTQTADLFAELALEDSLKCALSANFHGMLQYRSCETDAALSLFRKSTELDPGWGEPWTNIGTVLWENEKLETALDCFEKGFVLSPIAPNVAEAYHGAVATLECYDRSRPFFEEIARRYPNFRKGRYFLIDVLMKLGDLKAALDEIESVILCFGPDEPLLKAALKVRKQVGPMQIQKTGGSTVSLCMIVKNEEAHIARCLSSLKPISDEMIVVDTGSTDATKDIANVYGAKILDFEWNDDFAAARNHGLNQARGNWVLIMDADEVISETDYDRFRGIVRRPPSQGAAFSIVTRNYTYECNKIGWIANNGDYPEEAGLGWNPSEKVRLFRRQQGVQFEFPVHELLEPSLKAKGIPIFKCHIPVHHFGRLRAKQVKRKGETYFKLGLEKLKQNGENPKALEELAAEASHQGYTQMGIELWERFLSKNSDSLRARINLAALFCKVPDFSQALKHARCAVSLSPESQEAQFNCAFAEFHLGQLEAALNRLKKVLKKHPDHYPTQFIAAAVQCCLGNNRQADLLKKQLELSPFRGKLNHAVEELIRSLKSADRSDCVLRLKRWFGGSESGLHEINGLCRQHGGGKDLVLEAV